MEASSLVAIEIASSKIKGAAATVAPDGRMTILAVEQTHAPNSVRHGRVQNVREVSAAVNDIIRKLENNPAVAPRKVLAVTLPVGGRSLSSVPASATLQFPREIEVSEQTIRRLRNEAEKDFVAAKNIEETVPCRYFVNNVQVSPAVGTVGNTLRGEFLMLTCARENRQNLERLKFESIRSGSVDYRLRALALADAVLTDDDRQLGCALVDFGAETTTISIYKNGTVAFVSTLPMGSRLITRDLMAGLTLTEAVAEDFKISLGNLGEQHSDNPNAEEVNNYVRARAGEIAANIVNQIDLSGIDPESLGAGIVLAGGGSQLPGFASLLASQSRLSVRVAQLPTGVRFVNSADAVPANIDIVALLLAADADTPGLSTIAGDEPAETIAVVEEEIPVVDDEPEEEKEEVRQPEVKSASYKSYNRNIERDDDDDKLFEDDPDEEENVPEAETYNPEDTVTPDTPGEGGIEGHKTNKSSLLASLAGRFARLFDTPEDDEDNNDN